MGKDKFLSISVIGFAVAALCCFTPVLVWAQMGIGLISIISYLDFVLLPILVIFAIIMGYALWRRKKV